MYIEDKMCIGIESLLWCGVIFESRDLFVGGIVVRYYGYIFEIGVI